jgi:hypothetical protein
VLVAVLAVAVCGPDIFGSGEAFAGRNRGTRVIKSVTPAEGDIITTFSFVVEVVVSSNAQTGTLVVTLNGEPLAMSGGPTVFTATVDPGPPLVRGANLLEVSVQNNGGNTFTKQSNFQYLPPAASARRITDPADLIEGPLAHGQVGDWLLENNQARFVIQDAPKRQLHSVGQYGGNVIDAERVIDGVRQGNDSFFEMQPMLNIETVINATSVEIVNDGQDGNAAIIRSCGPDDLLDYINASTLVKELTGTFPDGSDGTVDADDNDMNVTACTEYILEANDTYMEVTTTVSNPDPVPVLMYIGDYVNGMGELEQWTPIGTNPVGIDGGIGEKEGTVSTAFMNFFGFGEGEGVDYSIIPISLPGKTDSSSFSQSGVSALIHSDQVIEILLLRFLPEFSVPAAVGGVPGTNSFTRFFGVGDGSGANAVAIENAVKGIDAGILKGCVTIGGAPAPGARVVAGVESGGALVGLRAVWVTDADGCYEGELPVGSYGVAASQRGTPYEGGGSTPFVHSPVSITSGGTTTQDVALPATGRIRVSVSDELGLAVPARVSIVGFDPSPEVVFPNSLAGVLNLTTGLFRDVTRDPLPFGLTAIAYAGADGVAEFDLEPETYKVYVSRGTEYSAFDALVTIVAGTTTPVSAQIAKVIDTPGFVSSDFHVHMLNSPDSSISFKDRVEQFAGEGVDNIVATDHDARTDLNPKIAELGLTPFVHATVGEEITTFDYGHFNGYPLGQDPSLLYGGSTDWGKAAPPGQDFPSSGNYTGTPAEIESFAVNDPNNTSAFVTVQVNHIDSHFDPLKIDTSLTPPQSQLTATERAERRFDPAAGELFNDFPALELWNGFNRNHQQVEFLDERIGIWMSLLNQGIETPAIADTDTHTFPTTRAAGARSWTASSTDDPASISDDEIGEAVQTGRVVGGQGLYVQTRLLATNGPGVADLTGGGSTLLTVDNNEADLEISVQAPIWAEYDTIEIYTNSTTCVASKNGATPTLFGALSDETLTAGASNTGTEFLVTEVNDYPGIPGARHLETIRTVRLSSAVLTRDTWVVVAVKGTDGVSRPMFPIFPADLDRGNTSVAELTDGNLGEDGVLALGFTNALYVDVDQNGEFDAPGVDFVDPCP